MSVTADGLALHNAQALQNYFISENPLRIINL
jgi:hypothetical protein